MKKMKIDIIIPSYKSKEITTLAIKSFEKNKGDFDFRYIVIENAGDESYKEDIVSLNKNVHWITNKCEHRYLSSFTNGEAVQKGLEVVESEYVFVCHNDVVATSPDWMSFLYSKIEEGCVIAGTVLDNVRIKAVHISGMLIKSEIAKSVEFDPINDDYGNQIMDVGDNWTQYCKDNDLKYYCCNNTHNENVGEIPEPYTNFHSDRAVDDDGNVIFLHLGRGTRKTLGEYSQPGKTLHVDWVEFVEREILEVSNG